MPLSTLLSLFLSGCRVYIVPIALESHYSLLDSSLLLAREASPQRFGVVHLSLLASLLGPPEVHNYPPEAARVSAGSTLDYPLITRIDHPKLLKRVTRPRYYVDLNRAARLPGSPLHHRLKLALMRNGGLHYHLPDHDSLDRFMWAILYKFDNTVQ